jgi:hypothetical protein
MGSDKLQGDASASPPTGNRTPLTRRQAIGRMSVFATAGAAAWVVPEILTARPADGATLSGPVTGAFAASAVAAPEVPAPAPAPKAGGSPSLAFTGLNIERDAQVGAALIAGGWAMHHWSSRTSPSTRPTEGRAPA